jgi:hypothetical protein
VNLLFDPEALVEAQKAALFYEDSQPGLGRAFLAGIRSCGVGSRDGFAGI